MPDTAAFLIEPRETAPRRAVADRVRSFHDAGADHVCIQVVADRATGFPLDAYRVLAAELLRT